MTCRCFVNNVYTFVDTMYEMKQTLTLYGFLILIANLKSSNREFQKHFNCILPYYYRDLF